MEEKVLDNITLHISRGEFMVICGPSGCGKTTLLRLLKQELAPVGICTGDIFYSKKPLEAWDKRTLIEEIGLVFQDPENQIVMDDVMQEMVFGMENLGIPHFEMRKRVAEMVHFFGMGSILNEKTSNLSGGQKQTLNLLSVLLLKPKVLLLDEPTSQLDPVAAKELIIMLERLNKEMGITIILVEHRLEELFATADHVLMMENGKVVHQGNSREVIHSIYFTEHTPLLPYIPSITRFYLNRETYPIQSYLPLTVKETKAWIADLPEYIIEEKNELLDNPEMKQGSYLSLKNVYYQYGRHDEMILKNLSFEISKGDFVALVGGNGSGKTTLLKACVGIIKPQRGTARLEKKDIYKLKGKELYNKMAYLPQNPRTYFVHDTLKKEMLEVITRHDIEDGEEKIANIVSQFNLSHLLERHPYDCSGGELQKGALACILLGNPEILFIDEPTKGLDPVSKKNFAGILSILHSQGLTIVMVTHDIEFAAMNAKRCAMMFDGEITAEGSPDRLFKDNYFYTTAINRATRRGNMSGALTLGEALQRWPSHVPI